MVARINRPGGRPDGKGFSEGIASDPDVVSEFKRALDENQKGGASPNHNNIVWLKTTAETEKERAHAGSAAWVEAPHHLAEFAQGSGPQAERHFVEVTNSDKRPHGHGDNAAMVRD